MMTTPKTIMTCTDKHRRSRGMTIVETMIGLVILAIFIAGSSRIFLAHRILTDMSREHYTAINIAKNRIELVRTFEYGQLNDFLEDDVLIDLSGTADISGNFRRSTELFNVSSNLVEVIITVEIRNRKTLEFDGQQETLTSYFAEYLNEDSAVGGGVAPNSI